MATFSVLITVPVKTAVLVAPGNRVITLNQRAGAAQWVDDRYTYATNVTHMAVSIEAERSP